MPRRPASAASRSFRSRTTSTASICSRGSALRPRPASALLGGYGRRDLVELSQQLHRLSAQLAVDRAPVGLRQLPRAVVELGVADLAVLGLLGRLEVRDARGDALVLGGHAAAQR